ENGEIRPGDSLTSSSQPGILMKASAGDSTVGVALEGLDPSTSSGQAGTIQVLISRRNKSLTVEQVEEKITQRVADMEIEDEVNLLISGAMDNLGMEEKINEVNVSVVDLASQSDQLDIQVNDLEQQVENLKSANEFDEMISVRALTIDEISNELDVDKFDNTKTAKISGSVENINLMRDSGLSSINNNSTSTDNVKSTTTDELENETSVEMGGIEPPSSWMISQNTRQATPTADLLYHNLDEFISLPEAGDVLVMDPENDNTGVKNYEKNSNKILGVALKNSENAKALLVLNGSAQVKISLENGEIKKGDLLTTSSMPGYAMKAIDENAGIIGIALENYLETDNLDNNKISVLLSIRNQVQVNWDDVTVSVVENLEQQSQVKVVVEDYDFQGKVSVKDLVVSGKVSVVGEAEFLAQATFKGNLNLQSAIMREYQEAENQQLAIGDAVHISGSNIVSKAYGDITDEDGNFRPAIGIVVEIVEQDGTRKIKVAIGGTVGGFKNLVPGAVYYLNNINGVTDDSGLSQMQESDISGNQPESAQSELIEMISLTNAPAKKIGNYIQSIAIAESENSLLILPSLVYEEYAEDVELPTVNYNPIYIDNVTIEQESDSTDDSGLTPMDDESSENDVEVDEEEDTENTENIEPVVEEAPAPEAPAEPTTELEPEPIPELAPEEAPALVPEE
ncbi:hypothetical protein KKA66_02760, partial [Patescibacteria group bacterium]|nr:hypothetical protein [Patescibacteria group bacterium]